MMKRVAGEAISAFFDALHGIAVGDSGTIVRTSDGGAQWSVQLSPQVTSLFGVAWGDINTAWIVGDFADDTGEGLVLRLKGPGKLFLQTRSPGSFVGWLYPLLPKPQSH